MSNPSASSRSALASFRCSEITPTAVSWLWEPYLARGKLSLLDGDPGTGKSFFTIDLAARISMFAPMPCSKNRAADGGNVLLLNAEDDARDTICPRLHAAGADPERVRVLAATGLGLERLPQFPDDLPALEAAIRESSASLVVIDPMMAFFPPSVNANNDQCIRSALTPLAAVAAATNACILLVRHMRKTGGPQAIYRGSGSIGIMGAVRTGLMIARHPDDPDLRVFTMSKTNLGAPGLSLGFRLTRDSQTAQTYVKWTSIIDVSADDLFGTTVPLRANNHPRERAAAWLKNFLLEGPRRATEIFAAALEVGIPERTLERVKAAQGVESNMTKRDGKIEWWWNDPAAERARGAGNGLPPLPDRFRREVGFGNSLKNLTEEDLDEIYEGAQEDLRLWQSLQKPEAHERTHETAPERPE